MITASIVTYNTPHQSIKKLINCVLESIVDVIFIIDHSQNDSLSILGNISNRIHYIRNANIGYGGGHNVAINKAIELNSKYHIVINPDIFFEKGVIEELYNYMEKNIECGLLMPKILYPNGEMQYLCKLLPTPYDLFIRRFLPFKKYVEMRNAKYELRSMDYDSIMEVPSLSGCFMFINMDVLKKIGSFDERFFMYAEDVDLCRRIGSISKTVYYPNVCVYHEYEKGSYKSFKLLKYHTISMIKYFNKWGWFIDKKREEANKNCLCKINYK